MSDDQRMCRQCGYRTPLHYFTICRACKNDNTEKRMGK